MALKKKRKHNRKPDVIDIEAREIPLEEETHTWQEPRLTETEELKLNQEIVSDILKESAEQSFNDAAEAAEDVVANVEDAAGAFEEAFENAEQSYEEAIKETAETVEMAEDTIQDAAEDFGQIAFDEIIPGVFEDQPAEEAEFTPVLDTAEVLSETAEENVEEVTEKITENAQEAFEEVNEAVEEVKEKAEETVEEAVENTEDTFNGAAEAVITEQAIEGLETEPDSEELPDETVTYVMGSGDSMTIADPGVTKEVSTFDTEALGKSDTMAKNKKEKKAKKVKVKKDRLGFNWFFWISFIVLCIPVGFFLYLLYSAAQETHTPIIGERINSEILYAIEDDKKAAIEAGLSSIEGVEKCTVNLIVETMRIEMDVRDDLTDEEMNSITLQAYEKINEILPVDTYFTQQNDYKQYDLEVYTIDNLDLEEFRVVLLNKNSKMENYLIQTITSPKNEEVAAELKELRAEQEAEREREKNEENQETEETESEGEEYVEPNENNIPADDTNM